MMICKRNRRRPVTAWAGAYQNSKNDDGQHASRRFIGDLCNCRAHRDEKRNPLEVKSRSWEFLLSIPSADVQRCYIRLLSCSIDKANDTFMYGLRHRDRCSSINESVCRERNSSAMSQSFCVGRVRCDSWRDKTQGGAVYYKGVWMLLFRSRCA